MAEKKYIPLDAAIEMFEQAFDNNWEVSGTLDRLRAIPAADVVERPRWIPVTERLPKDEKDVLACYGFRHDGKMGGMRFIQPLCYFRFNKEPHWQFEGTNGMEVTHWMPLPEQPKEDAT